MALIGSLAVNIVARTDQLKKGLGDARREVKKFDGGLAGSFSKIKAWHGAIAQAAGAAGLGFLIRQQLREIDALGEFSDRLGISTESLASLHHAAELSGVATNTVNMGLQRMVRRVAEAARGTGEAVKALQELGVSAESLVQMAPDRQFGVLADALNRVGNESDKVRLAFKLFDSEGVALLQMTQDGSKGLAEMADEAERLGKTMSRQQVAQVEALNDSITRLTASFAGLGRQIAGALAKFAPLVDKLSEGVALVNRKSGVIGSFTRVLSDTFDLKSLSPRALTPSAFEEFRLRLRNALKEDVLQRTGGVTAITPKSPVPINQVIEAFSNPLRKGVDFAASGLTKLNRAVAEGINDGMRDASVHVLRPVMRDVGASLREQALRKQAFNFEAFREFGLFFRNLSFRPEPFRPSLNAALEAGTSEAFIAQRSGRRQEFIKEVAKLQKEEVNLSKEIKGVLSGIWDTLKDTGSNVISIPH